MVGKRVLGLVLMSVASAGCAVTDASGDVAATADTRPAIVTNCGTFDLDQRQGMPDSAMRCFVDAVAEGRPVQLKETRPTMEGDPITVIYRADAQRRVDVITDSRQDRFGARIISRQTCIGPVPAVGELTFAHCSEPTPIKD